MRGKTFLVCYDLIYQYLFLCDMIRMGVRVVEMRKVYATLRALLDVLEVLVGPSPTDRLGRQILEEVIHVKAPDCANPFPLLFIYNCMEYLPIAYFIKSCSTFMLVYIH
jgi:hypothetical protein